MIVQKNYVRIQGGKVYEEKIPFKRLGTVEEGYGQERQAAGKQIQILNTGNQTVTVKAVSAEGYVVGIPEGSITISDMTWNKWLNQITFGKFFNKTQKVEITAHDTGTGIANIVYYVAEGGRLGKFSESIECTV